MVRPHNIRTPCDRCPRTAHLPLKDRQQENALDVTELTLQIYQHYRECRATGQFPNDGLVRYHAALIRGIEDAVARQEQEQQMMQLAAMASVRRG